jgi:hypothetical protein
MTHPGFLDQPFIKVPNAHPNQDVDFRAGEVIYSNPLTTEWSRLSYLSMFTFWFYSFVYWPTAQVYKTHIPNAIRNGFEDSAYAEFSIYSIDTLGAGVVAYPLFFGLTGYICHRLLSLVTQSFVVKLQFNRSKDLVFITTVGEMGQLNETVHELANLEHTTPALKASNVQNSGFEKGGFICLKDLSQERDFYGRVSLKLVTGSQNGQ